MSTDRTSAQRLRRYLEYNLVGLGGSAVVVASLYPVMTRHPGLLFDVAFLSAAWVIVAAGWWLARRGPLGAACALLTLGTWVAVVAVTYVSPFILPVNLIALLSPTVVLLEHLRPLGLRVSIGLTLLASGLLCIVAEARRGAPDVLEPEPWLAGLLLAVFVPVVSAVVVAGIAQQVRRLTVQADELASSRSRLAAAADEARSAIERDLHDGAQQQLVTVSVELGRVARLVARDPARGAAEIAQVHALLQIAIRELRDLAHGIYPALLTERGLEAALPAAARRTATPCTVQVAGLDRLPRHVEAAVYFCCVEAMHNADKHAGAERIEVTVRRQADDVTFSVTDDGCGFPVPPPRGAHGLTGMADRIRAIGGELTVVSAPGTGTTVTARVPGSRESAP